LSRQGWSADPDEKRKTVVAVSRSLQHQGTEAERPVQFTFGAELGPKQLLIFKRKEVSTRVEQQIVDNQETQ
jgi:hypothetical protein